MNSHYGFQYETDPHNIIDYLKIGTKIPIWKEFEKFIFFDLRHFNTKSIISYRKKSNGQKEILGHVLTFIVEKVLYFGFFGIINDVHEEQERLISKLIEYAQENKCEKIKGPINIPTVIYGWGFMAEGSETSLFVSKPVNSPDYINSFLKLGFKIIAIEHTWEGYFEYYYYKYLKFLNLSDKYEIEFHNWEEIRKLKWVYLDLNARNLPETSILTPHTDILFDSYLDFIKRYGYPSMVLFARFKENNKYVGCITCLPNPFPRKGKEKIDSLVLYSLVVDPEHRKKGLGWFLNKIMVEKAIEKDFSFISTPIEKSVKTTQKMAEKGGLKLTRKHVILEYSI